MIALAALTVTAAAAGLAAWVALRPPRRFDVRLAPYLKGAQARLGVVPDPHYDTTFRATLRQRMLIPARRTLARFASRAAGLEQLFATEPDSTLAVRLAQAGMTMSPAQYRQRQTRSAVAGVLAGSILGGVFAGTIFGVAVAAMAGCALGLAVLPQTVSVRVERRKETIEREVYTVFLRLSFATRGPSSSLRDAIRATAARGQGVLIDELREIENWLRSGMAEAEAFAAAAERTPEPTAARAYRRLALGNRGDIPTSLRAIASDARSQRAKRIKEQAVRRRLAMVGISALVLLPVVFVIYLAPIDAMFFAPL